MPAASSTPDREILAELNALHARVLLRMPWLQAALMLAIGSFVYARGSSTLVGGWVVATVGVESLRACFGARVLRLNHALEPRQVHRQLVFLAALSGATLGLGVALVMPGLPVTSQALLGVFAFAVPAAGVAVSQSSRYIMGAYAFAILLPAAVSWIVVHPEHLLPVGIGTCIFWMLMILVATDGDRLLRRSVEIRHERDRLIEDLEQKNREVQAAVLKAEAAALSRSRVLAAASHDLRQPLHALSVYSAVLGANPAPAVLSEVGVHIVEIVRSLGNVLNGVLDLSRLSSGHYVEDRQQIGLDAVIASVCSEFAAAAATKGLTFTLGLEPVIVRSDPVAITRIARNLIDNAIKYTEIGAVEVKTYARHDAEGARAVFTVIDTGKGISGHDQERIFEEFYQVDNPGRDRSRGVGLGLAIARKLAELLDVQISVRSTIGVGSSFEVTMPAAVTSDALPDVPLGAARRADLRGRAVQVIDDEIDILRGTRALLGSWGATVYCATSPAEAEATMVSRGAPDLLIADLRLAGDEQGIELAARLRRQFGTFPVLIVSGETSAEARTEAGRHAFPLLQKPVSADLFADFISAALQKSG